MTSRLYRATLLTLFMLLAVSAAACDSDPPACRVGTICTWAGNGEPAFDGDGNDRREAMLYWPIDLAFAPDGRAYVLDWQNHRVRRVNLNNKFETVLGNGDVGDGPDERQRTNRARRSRHGLHLEPSHRRGV